MNLTSQRARITGPVSFRGGSGRKQAIPIGPCLIESCGGRVVDIIWGTRGQNSVALPVEEVTSARERGDLVLLE